MPHSSLFSNLHVLYQVSLFKIQLPCSKIGCSSLYPSLLPLSMPDSRVRFRYGGYASGVSVQGFQFYVLSPNVTAEQNKAIFFQLFEFAHSLPGLSIQNSTAVFED